MPPVTVIFMPDNTITMRQFSDAPTLLTSADGTQRLRADIIEYAMRLRAKSRSTSAARLARLSQEIGERTVISAHPQEHTRIALRPRTSAIAITAEWPRLPLLAVLAIFALAAGTVYSLGERAGERAAVRARAVERADMGTATATSSRDWTEE